MVMDLMTKFLGFARLWPSTSFAINFAWQKGWGTFARHTDYSYSWHHKSAYTHLHVCGLERSCACPQHMESVTMSLGKECNPSCSDSCNPQPLSNCKGLASFRQTTGHSTELWGHGVSEPAFGKGFLSLICFARHMKLFDLSGEEDDRKISPYCWRIRLALAYKDLHLPWRAAEKDAIAFSGQGQVFTQPWICSYLASTPG